MRPRTEVGTLLDGEDCRAIFEPRAARGADLRGHINAFGGFMMELSAVIQARMSSRRLPGKVMRDLGGTPALAHVVKRCRGFATQVVVCTSTDASDDPIAGWCDREEVLVVRGSLDNVFARFRQTLRHPQLRQTEFFARVTADCPLVSDTLANEALQVASSEHADYVGFTPDSVARGLAVEILRTQAFERIDIESLSRYEREHVAPRLYNGVGHFNAVYISAPKELAHAEVRLTLDYPEDAALLDTLLSTDTDMTAEEAVRRVLEDPQLFRMNAHCRQLTDNQQRSEPDKEPGAN
ncbi:MAG: NTP transferase domain-containing protein [Myxococcota bacterium]